jgi:hypothetical protein
VEGWVLDEAVVPCVYCVVVHIECVCVCVYVCMCISGCVSVCVD